MNALRQRLALNSALTANCTKNESRWAIVLSGGDEGEMRSVFDAGIEYRQPNQYSTFVGTRSLLQHTLDRATSLVAPGQVLTTIGHGHQKFLAERQTHTIPGSIIEQPRNLGTAPGVLLPLAYVIDNDPQATVILFPSDHFVHPEGRFLDHVVRASQLAEECPDQLILVGAIPDCPEVDYGWILAGETFNSPERSFGGSELRQVEVFREKPEFDEANALLQQLAYWNTMVIAVKAKTLWNLARPCLPEMMASFDAFRQILCAVRDQEVGPEYETNALHDLYRKLTPADFSRDILENVTAHALVMPMMDVTWSDWGRDQRVRDSLARLGQLPIFEPELPLHSFEATEALTRSEFDHQKLARRSTQLRHKQVRPRYGVEIRGVSVHAEADELSHISTLLKGLDGRVHVFDRETSSLLIQGSVEEVCDALRLLNAAHGTDVCERQGE